jgi:oxygen-independent coproporphyrinogen-3 oxidase
MYMEAMERLERAGYDQYEISNVARQGRQSRHNLKYWTDGEWLGFGCGAHSTREAARWKNVAGIDDYVGRIARGEPAAIDRRRLSDAERLGDALFTRLRLVDGLDEQVFAERYGIDVWARYGPDLEPFLESGVLTRDAGRIFLTRRGMLVANEVMSVFV